MSRIRNMTVGILVSLLCASIVQAQQPDVSSQTSASNSFPRLVRFGGTLPERRGASPTSAASARVSFSIYEEQSGGAALWSEVQDVRHDAQGRYSVLLGAASSDGLPAELFSTAGARWLGVQVEGRQEESRILLVAVPYALKAADADTLGGKPATAYVASDQLKEQVQSEVTAQVTQSATGQSTRTLVGTAPTPQVIAETSPATFTCATSGICVQSTQSGAGGIALRAATGSATSTTAIFDNLGGGKILSGRTTGYAEKFRVDSGGNVWGGGSIQATAYAATSGAAIFGVATAGSGATVGVRGQAASPSGMGVFGYATSPTGATFGMRGQSLSTSGTGLSGSASALTGNTIGIRALTQSPSSTAAIFDNLGGGKIISARTTGYAEKFSVDGSGNVVSGSVSSTTSGSQAISGYGYDVGVFGNGSSYGVFGDSSSGYGVYGQGAIGVSGVGSGVTTSGGVTGYGGSNGYGVYGHAGAYGVYGESSSGYGVYGTSPSFVGVLGVSSLGTGVRGEGDFGVAGFGVQYGFYGSTANGWGVFGQGATGVYGQGSSYGVFSQGTLGASGSKPAVVALPDNRVVELYATESPEVWFEDFGTASLSNGVAEVTLDPTFALTVNTELDYHVFPVPNGDCGGLYVAQKTPRGFQIRELHSGKSNISFDYRIVAKRRGFESVRLQEVDADADTVASIREHNHARSGRATLRIPKKLAAPEAPRPLPASPGAEVRVGSPKG